MLNVRGGFDSHAFPPLVAAWLLLAPAAWSAPAPADTTHRRAAAADSLRADRRLVGKPLIGFDRPRWVMLRSLVVPGWGQAHNGAWIKAIAIASGEVWVGAGALQDHRSLDDLRAQVDAAEQSGDEDLANAFIERYNDRLNRFNNRQWLFGGLLAYSLLDAYIDAHFRNFKIEFEQDPALPAGTKTDRGFRLGVRWSP